MAHLQSAIVFRSDPGSRGIAAGRASPLKACYAERNRLRRHAIGAGEVAEL